VYTLDTNAVIYYVKDDKDAAPILQAIFDDPTIPVCVSALTEAELFSPPILDAKEEESIEHVLRSVSRIPLDSQIALHCWTYPQYLPVESSR